MEQFHYRTEAGDDLVLPKIGNVPAGVWRKLRGVTSSLDITFGLLEGCCDAKQLEAVDRMTLDEVNTMFGEWQGMTSPGESSGSSTASSSTEGPSSTTGDTASTSV